MMFADFARAHGLILPGQPVVGKWVRVPTDNHPRKRNGAYKYLGAIGWVQDHATMPEVEVWRPEREEVQRIDMARIEREVERERERMRRRWSRAAGEAGDLIGRCRTESHPYMQYKGLGDELALVDGDTMVVPMRHWRTNAVVGAQTIRWLPDEKRYDKRMLPGTRAKGAVLRLGSTQAPRSWLVEGYATGLSVAAALRLMRSRDSVLVCFSSGNLTYVAQQLGGNLIAFADRDQSGAGERAARECGVPYVMSPELGEDANDVHARRGIFALAQIIRGAAMT